MHLVLTHYIDTDAATVVDRLRAAVTAGLDAAAARMATRRDDVVTEATGDGLRIRHGVTALDGAELHVSGDHQLTELRITVPWQATDSGTPKLWGANRFAGVVAEQLRTAA